MLQLCGNGVILQQERLIPVRHFAKEANRPVLKGDGELKFLFFSMYQDFLDRI
jgi:hypothetical protein